MSLPNQFFPKLDIVEDLAVEGDTHRFVVICHGLMAAAQIDDAQACMSQPNLTINKYSSFIRAAVPNGSEHAIERRKFHARSIQCEDSANATHILIRVLRKL